MEVGGGGEKLPALELLSLIISNQMCDGGDAEEYRKNFLADVVVYLTLECNGTAQNT